MSKRYLTAESVCAGHPDKLCDIIADNILDECFRRDKASRVACEAVSYTHLDVYKRQLVRLWLLKEKLSWRARSPAARKLISDTLSGMY